MYCVHVYIVLYCIGCIVRCIVGQPLANLDVCSSSLRILTAVIWKYFLSLFPFVYSVYSSKYVTTALILLFCVVTIISHKMQSCKLLYISYYYSLFTFPADMSEEAIQNQHERGIEKTSKLWKYALIKYMHEGSSNCGIPLFWCFKNSPPNQEKLFFMKIIMLFEPAPTRVLGWLFFLFS